MTTVAKEQTGVPAGAEAYEGAKVATGVAAAAMVAAGIGTFITGVMTTGAVISAGLKEALNLYNPAGPLSGKTTVGVLAWLISWYLINRAWHDQDRNLKQAFTITLVLIFLGLVLTFPPVFEAFE